MLHPSNTPLKFEVLKSKFVNYQSNVKDFVVNDWLQSNSTQVIVAKEESVRTIIDNYERLVKLQAQRDDEESLKDAWDSYTNTIKQQEQTRLNGLILETCALHFGESDYYSKGKLCYYSVNAETN